MPCSGNPGQGCGGPDRLSVYSRPGPAGPQTNPGPDGWRSLGCLSDSVSVRSLPRLGAAGDQVTVAVCAAACAGSKYFGVEYAAECFCRDEIDNVGASVADECSMPCKGNRDELLGGSNRLNLYQVVALATSSSIAPMVSSTVPSSLMVPSSTIAATATSTYIDVLSSTSASAPSRSSLTTIPSPKPSSFPDVAPSSSVTPLYSSLSAVTSPSPLPQPVCAPTILTSGQISNGGFELGSTWAVSSSSNAVSSEVYGLAYEGRYPELISPIIAPNNLRFVTIKSNANITLGSTHTLSFYLGRRVATRSSDAIVNIRVNVPAGVSWSQTFQVCSGAACNLPGSGGTVWKKHQANVNFLSGQELPLQITTTWSGAVQLDVSNGSEVASIRILQNLCLTQRAEKSADR
ncbi:hypothetical protein G6011_07608 [Alternaria panax]|uniref:WSC domain-containing protein n=1 Tax=Alternaria panax TaxID=48097 RepID=A0AAD4FF95_9PLEO|nr:hypothetical protein G6011_07608 [Alternaria panax]